ncbi:hypothetical protein CYY_002420 [Polysphondylium violaceum]|uniref:Survival of motor neuron-related-splicing factor 30 n=1 Tax=Polysphondylium violaceum TaxID=133409 RepID=A0A8J4V0V3_9MYCE|nr:hypothetical protein CYY_002420 [Polysphondylium violaceum]
MSTIQELENKLESDKKELQEIELLLEEDPNDEELINLKNDLVSLIKTTSDLIINTKRSLDTQLSNNSNTIDKALDSSNSSNNNNSINTTTQAAIALEPVLQYNDNSQIYSSSGRMTVGTQCEAQYSVDGVWYAAIIDSINKDGTYAVTYPEYGNSETLSIDKIRPPSRSQRLVANSTLETKKYQIAPDAIQQIPKSLKVLPEDTEQVKKQKLKKIQNIKSQNRLKEIEDESKKKKQEWRDFINKPKKSIPGTFTDKKKKSMFSTSDNINSKVGVIGSGRGMTENQSFTGLARKQNTFMPNN